MKLEEGKTYTYPGGEIKISVHKIHYQDEEGVFFFGVLSHLRIHEIYELKNYRLYHRMIKHWIEI